MATETDIRVLVPRVRRALTGPDGSVSEADLSDDAIKDIVADALADIMLYTGGVFGKTLIVTDRDTNDAPSEYATSDELTLAETSMVAAQAALNHFFNVWANVKTSERIQDERTSWEWSRSANLLVEWLKQLRAQRDEALALANVDGVLDSYASTLAIRDQATSLAVEPYATAAAGVGGQQPWI